MENEWISIEDERPEWGQTIIVFRQKIMKNMQSAWKFNLPKVIEIINTYDASVTHWMPIPEFPRDMTRCLCGQSAVEDGYCRDCI